MATNNSTNTSKPVSVTQGGTGDASLTAYAVVCGGTTSTGALQSIAGVGSSTQVLTSNGASALPTFQAAPTGGGSWVKLATTSGTNVAALALTSAMSSTYKNYAVLGFITSLGTAQNLIMEASTDNGSTWLTTGYDSFRLLGSTLATSSATTSMLLNASQTNNTQGGILGYIYNIGTSTNAFATFYEGYRSGIGGTSNVALITCRLPTSTSINAIRFRQTTTNCTGTVTIYGIST